MLVDRRFFFDYNFLYRKGLFLHNIILNTDHERLVDKTGMIVYTVFSDRVAETCEARDRGSSCGGSLFIYGGTQYAEAVLNI